MTADDLITYGGLVLFVTGFTTVGFQIVYGICDAERIVPARVAKSATVVRTQARQVVVAVCLVVADRLSTPKGVAR